MLDVGAGAYPVFADYNGDGLQDLFVGNFGYYDSSYYDEFLILYSDHTSSLGLLINKGTAQNPEFRKEDTDFAGASSLERLSLIPTFGDLDGDSDLDMLLGNEDGRITRYDNTAGPGNPMNMEFRTDNYLQIDVGTYSAPFLYDINRDDLIDLVVGKRNGTISYYRNEGSPTQPDFNLVTDFLGEINVTNPNVSLDGYSVPVVFDDRGEASLLVGSEDGKIFYYRHFYDYLDDAFPESDSLFDNLEEEPVNPDRGYRTAAVAADLNADGHVELVAGNFSGGLEFFGKASQPPVDLTVDEKFAKDESFIVFPIPADDYINIYSKDGHSEFRLIVSDLSGKIVHEVVFNTQVRINVSSWKEGIYILTFVGEDFFEARKTLILRP
jgi:hypothetical protein